MTNHWMVHLGVLNHLNLGNSYAFPTADAAKFFAINHKRRDPHRDIRVETPAGTITETPLIPGSFWERDFEAESKLPEDRRAAAEQAAKQRVRDEASRWQIPA